MKLSRSMIFINCVSMCTKFLVTIIALLKLSETFVDSSLEEIVQTYANALKLFKTSLK